MEDFIIDGIFGRRLKEDTFSGIENGRKALTGPEIVQLDLTNNCNLNCAGCWCHSELMGELKFSSEKKKEAIARETLLTLIRDFREMDVKEVQLSGSGDPMMSEHIYEALEELKKADLKVHLITNFTLATKSFIERIISLKIDRLTVSLWAGTKETYEKTHPNRDGRTFDKIIENLRYLHSLKQEDRLPKVRIYNVISSLNYQEIEKMVETSILAMADFVEFQAIDIVEGKSDSLMITEKMYCDIERQFERLKKKDSYFSDLIGYGAEGSDGESREMLEFGRFYKNTLPEGFVFENVSRKVRCPKGYISEKRRFNIHTRDSFMYHFPQEICGKCNLHQICYKSPYPFRLEWLSLLGHGSFYRRVKNAGLGNPGYDTNIVDTLPCYVGWTYTRILPNGDVIPCCKAHKKPLGNLSDASFKEIWHSMRYDEFRELAKKEKKSHPYFKIINCYKSCDNIGMNLETDMQVRLFKGKEVGK